MWPPLNYLHPALAVSLLQYRIDRADSAAANARSYQQPGLMYPWESTLTGVPADTWQKFGRAGDSCETYEIHINGDIAQALWRYHAASRNDTWLCEGGGLRVLRGIASFYAARVTRDPWAAQRYQLLLVTGPDEQAPEVNNSCYVSSIAALTMLAASKLSSLCGLHAPSNWTEIAHSLRIPFNSSGHFHPEYDGYVYGRQVKAPSS